MDNISWKNILIFKDDKIKNAIHILEKGLRIALVIDSNNSLLGTITDGDIRRGLLKGISIQENVEQIMCLDPMTANITDSINNIQIRMRNEKLLHMPIVDTYGKIVGLELYDYSHENCYVNNPVLIQAGGFGKRLGKLTTDTPKPMLKIGGIPILERILTNFKDMGFKEFYISTHFKPDVIKNYFGQGDSWDISIQYVHEEKPLGTAGSLGLLPKNMSKNPLIVINGDIITKLDFTKLIEFHDKENNDITLCGRNYNIKIPYGVIKL